MSELEVKAVTLRFGGLVAIDNVSLVIEPGELHAVVGPNGAGKTSLVNCISGYYRPQHGEIRFNGKDITRASPHVRARLGLGRTFQNVEVYRTETVLDNVLLGRHIHLRQNPLTCALYWGPARRQEFLHRRRVREILDLVGLVRYSSHAAGSMSFGLQKLVEVARALAMEPSLMLLDEPTSGMSMAEKERMARVLLSIKYQMKLTQILIEHDVPMVSEICDRATVLNFGRKLAEGAPKEVFKEPAVVEAYMGSTPSASLS